MLRGNKTDCLILTKHGCRKVLYGRPVVMDPSCDWKEPLIAYLKCQSISWSVLKDVSGGNPLLVLALRF